MRASRFAERGWVRWLSPESLSPEVLATLMVEALAAPRPAVPVPPDLGGRDRAARHLVSVLGPRDAPAEPALFSVNGTARPTGTGELLGERAL